jgi:lysophospholipase L1-like esterase
MSLHLPLLSRRFFTLSALLAGVLLGPLAPARAADDSTWVATWGASPQLATEPIFGPPPQPVVFTNQTVRTMARISKGGERVRVRVDNTFGTAALVIGAARVAVHGSGSGIVAGTDRVLTFGGSPTITIPPGAPALSDPVDLKVADLSELAISIHLPSETVALSVHTLGRQTTYIAGAQTGDLTGAPTIPTPTTTEVRYFVSGVEVDAGEKMQAIVTLGDSITDGYASTVDANRRWPDRLAERLLDKRGPHRLAVVNEGISGNRVLHDIIGPNTLSRFDRDVLAQAGVGFIVVLVGINDIGFSAIPDFASQAVSAEQIIQGWRQLITRAHAKGIKVIGGTLLPFEGAGYYSAEGEAKRQAVNAFVRTSGAFDDVIDFDLATRDPAHPTRLLPQYDSGDHLHPNDSGYRAMADAIDLSIFRRRPGRQCCER